MIRTELFARLGGKAMSYDEAKKRYPRLLEAGRLVQFTGDVNPRTGKFQSVHSPENKGYLSNRSLRDIKRYKELKLKMVI